MKRFLLLLALLMPSQLDGARNTRPTTPDHLWDWIRAYTGVAVPRSAVCHDHAAPFDLLAQQFLERPMLSLWHGPRGSGKSFLSAIDTHLVSRFSPKHLTRILGGSKAQSEQIYAALEEAVLDGHGPAGSDAGCIQQLAKEKATYTNGSKVSILAASMKAVRGPHGPSLKLDEVDEIEPEVREGSIGMAMEKRGVRSSILMTSTWHRVNGPMQELLERGRSGEFPCGTWCVFEVLERCPDSRSGPELERCPECPLKKWCHSDKEANGGVPKAKRSNGHYTIDSLIQKVKAVSERTFDSDYLCLGPKAAGIWFTMFSQALHVSPLAEYDPRYPVHIAVDPGLRCGAIIFQVRPKRFGKGYDVNVFADYFAEAVTAERNAVCIRALCETMCGQQAFHRARVSMDSAGDVREAVGSSVRGEFERAGLKGRNGLESWPIKRKADALALTEAFLQSADGTVSLTIHPRCRHLIQAMLCYARAKVQNQWMDYPQDPQHPFEDLVDTLVGGLKTEFPDGRAPEPNLRRMHAGGI
jgi:hypothetical protein